MEKERLAELMEAADVTQEELAIATGKSEPTINHYLSGRRKIQPDFDAVAESFLLEKAAERVRFIREVAGVNGH